jgi:hypothetical protein
MSSFELIGGILKLYSRVQHTLNTWRGQGSGRHVESFEKDVATEEIIFREFLHILLPVDSRADLHQATRPSSIRSVSQGSILEPSPPYAVSQSDEARSYSAFGAFTSYLRGSIRHEAVPWRDLALGSPASLEMLFDERKVDLVLKLLEDIQQHLRAIEKELSNSTVSRVSYNQRPPPSDHLITSLFSVAGLALRFHQHETPVETRTWSALQVFQKS